MSICQGFVQGGGAPNGIYLSVGSRFGHREKIRHITRADVPLPPFPTLPMRASTGRLERWMPSGVSRKSYSPALPSSRRMRLMASISRKHLVAVAMAAK